MEASQYQIGSKQSKSRLKGKMGGDLNICGDVTQEEFNSGSFLGLFAPKLKYLKSGMKTRP